MKEAYLAGDLYIDAEGLSAPGGPEIQQFTKSYVDAVIQKEWPVIAAGELVEPETHGIIDQLSHRIIAYAPESDRDLVVYAEVLSGLNDLLDQRRERLHLGRDGVGIVTWMVVMMGALITIGMAWFHNTRGARALWPGGEHVADVRSNDLPDCCDGSSALGSVQCRWRAI